MFDLAKVKSLGAWQEARRNVETAVREVLGPIPKNQIDIQLKTVDEMDYAGYTRRRVNYFVDEWTRVAAWLFLPEGREEAPAILCCHGRVKQGKDEAAGMTGDPTLAFAQRFAEMGYATLAPDCITVGERAYSRTHAFDTKPYYKDHPKLSLAGKFLADHIRALDIFTEIRRVDAARIGVVGHGLGGFNAMLLAAFDDRVQSCVASCGFTRLETDPHPERWTEESETGLPLMPALEQYAAKHDFPFDFEHILALAAPTATLVVNSTAPACLDEAKSVHKAVDRAGRVYKQLGAASALELYEHNDGESVNPPTLEVIDEWFDRWL